MVDKISRILDECLSRIASGETIEECLKDYRDHRHELEPLLQTGELVKQVPSVSPSAKFRRASKARLMTKIRKEISFPEKGEKANVINSFLQDLLHIFSKRRLVTVTVSVLAVLIAMGLLLPHGVNPFKTQPVKAAEITLSVLSGDVEILSTDSNEWQVGADRLILDVGSRVRTAADSHAVLTFINGSTAKLESNSDVTITASEYKEEISTKIILSQHSGSVWSHIATDSLASSDYKIVTPSASVIARGTSFVTEVNASGATRVITIEGTVSVTANESEVSLIKDQQVMVSPGRIPDEPQPVANRLYEIVISTGPSAVMSIRDPSGSSTGFFPNGVFFNQIRDSKTWLMANGQKIQINEPVPGEYQVVVRRVSREDVTVSIQITSSERVITQLRKALSGTETGWIIHFELKQNVSKSGVSIQSIESLEEKKPENVVVTNITEQEAVPITQRPVDTTDTENPSLETSNTEVDSANSQTTDDGKLIDSQISPDDSNATDENKILGDNETETSPSTTETNITATESTIIDEEPVDSEQETERDDSDNPPVDVDTTPADDLGADRIPDTEANLTTGASEK